MKEKLLDLIFKPVSAQDATEVIIGKDVSKDTLAGVTPGEGNFGSLAEILTFTINLVFIIGLALALLFVVIGGIKYVVSSGDEGKATEARNTITNAVIGAVVIIGFRVIFQVVLNLLGWSNYIPGA